MHEIQEKWRSIADNIYALSYQFSNMGLQVSTRMTVVKLSDGSLLSHSAVPLTPTQKQQLDSMGPLRHIVAPSAMHHLFVGDLAAQYPKARIYGTKGVRRKRPDLMTMELLPTIEAEPWAGDLEYLRFGGIPMLDETVWFHPASGSLIATDILQCWKGPLSLPVRLYLGLTGGHERLTVPRSVRLLVKDKAAVKASATQMQQWPVQRVILLHNSVIEDKASLRLAEALSVWN